MAHSYISIYTHYIFSTKNRQKIIPSNLQQRLWAYIGGIAKENGMKALAVGGTEDHVHILLAMPATLSPAKAVQLIKGGSSKWVSKTFPKLRNFAWQEGYGAFSISISHVENTVRYINNQVEHHKNFSFQEEYLRILKKHGVKYDEKYLWG